MRLNAATRTLLYGLCAAVAIATFGVGQAHAVPATTSFEGMLRTTGGNAAPDGKYKVTFGLYAAKSGGAALWSEAGELVVAGGGFRHVLGSSKPLTPGLLGEKELWLSIKVLGEPELPRVRLNAVPYAVRARLAEKLVWDGVTCPKGKVSVGRDKTGKLVCVDDADTTYDLSPYAKSADLAKVAKSGKYADLAGKPVHVQVGKNCPAGKVLAGHLSDGKQICVDDNDTTYDLSPYAKSADLHKVAKSGKYGDLGGKPTLVALGKQCASGTVLRGVKADGTYDCIKDKDTKNTYTGKHFALSNQGCASGFYVSKVDADGKVVCAKDKDTRNTYTGKHFALSNQACATGYYVAKVGGDGKVVCAKDKDTNTTYSGKNFALANQGCKSGYLVRNIDSNGKVVCIKDANTTYSSKNFVPSNQSCPTGQALIGHDSNGKKRCASFGQLGIEKVLGYGNIAGKGGSWSAQGGSCWGEPRFSNSCAYTATSSSNSSGSESLEWSIPSGMKTAYVSFLSWSAGGYFDIQVRIGSTWKFHRRINAYNPYTSSAGGTHDGNIVVTAATGLNHFSRIRIQNRKGRIYFTGLGFSSKDMLGSSGTNWTHWDNVIHKPSIAYTSKIAADDFTQTEVTNLRSAKLDNGTTPWTDGNKHNHRYNVNDPWLRENGDNAHFKTYSKYQVVSRTDGTAQYASGIGNYPWVWMYGGDAASNRRMMLNTDGNLWTSKYGWLGDYFIRDNQVCSSGQVLRGFNSSGNKVCVTDNTTNGAYVKKSGDTMSGTLNMNNRAITNLDHLHFGANIRIYDQGDDQYLNFKYGDGGTGGIIFWDGQGTRQGYLVADGHPSYPSFGLKDADGNWAVRVYDDQYTSLYRNGSERLRVTGGDTYSFANIHMGNRSISNVTQLHFNDNVRFNDQGNDQYLRLTYLDYGQGGLQLADGNHGFQGGLYSNGGSGNSRQVGLVDGDSTFGVRVQTNSYTDLLVNNSLRFRTTTGDSYSYVNINMNGKKVVNLANPSSNQDAATKKYVDDRVNGNGLYVKKTGDTMSGTLNMNARDVTNVSTLQFRDNVRFYDTGNDQYLVYKYGDSGQGGIQFYEGNTVFQGGVYANGSSGNSRIVGLVDGDGTYSVSVQTNSYTSLLVNGSTRFRVSAGETDSYTTVDFNNHLLHRIGEVRWYDNIRMYDDGNDNYLNLRYGDAGTGGFTFWDGSGYRQGYVVADGDNSYPSIGFKDKDNSWAVRVRRDDYVNFYVNGAQIMNVDNAGVGIMSNARSGYALDVGGHVDMSDRNLNYANQVHFNHGNHFYENNDGRYLNYKWASGTTGGIQFYDGNGTRQGLLVGDGGSTYPSFGLKDADGNWAVRVYDDQYTALYRNGVEKFRVGSSENESYQQLDMNNKKIVRVATPTSSSDAANKAYVDAQVVTASGGANYGLAKRYPVVLMLHSATYCPSGWTRYNVSDYAGKNGYTYLSMNGGGVYIGGLNDWSHSEQYFYARLHTSHSTKVICTKTFNSSSGRPYFSWIGFSGGNSGSCPSGYHYVKAANTMHGNTGHLQISDDGARMGYLDTWSHGHNSSEEDAGTIQRHYNSNDVDTICFKVMGVDEDSATKNGVFPFYMAYHSNASCPSGFISKNTNTIDRNQNGYVYVSEHQNGSAIGGIEGWGHYGNYNNRHYHYNHMKKTCWKFYAVDKGTPTVDVMSRNGGSCPSGFMSFNVADLKGWNNYAYARAANGTFHLGGVHSWGAVDRQNGRMHWRWNGSQVTRVCVRVNNVK